MIGKKIVSIFKGMYQNYDIFCDLDDASKFKKKNNISIFKF